MRVQEVIKMDRDSLISLFRGDDTNLTTSVENAANMLSQEGEPPKSKIIAPVASRILHKCRTTIHDDSLSGRVFFTH